MWGRRERKGEGERERGEREGGERGERGERERGGREIYARLFLPLLAPSELFTLPSRVHSNACGSDVVCSTRLQPVGHTVHGSMQQPLAP